MLNELQAKAEIAMIKVQGRALEKGIVCCKPLVEGTRYDLILDDGDKLLRAQVKYCDRKASYSSDSISISLKSSRGQGANRTYTAAEIDVLLVYVKEVDRICYVPVGEIVDKASLCLRLKPTENNQKVGVKMASNFFW